jgi:hypothetical protein
MRRGPATFQVDGAPGEQLTFIDAPPFCPTWPKPNTLADRALRMLLDGKVFDHPDFLDGCGSWRLAAVVFQLRALGWPIETVEIPSPSEEHPERMIALYRLAPKFVARALAMMAGETHAC